MTTHIPYEETGWTRVTAREDEEQAPLRTRGAWAVEVTPRELSKAVGFARRHDLDPRTLGHLRQVTQIDGAMKLLLCPEEIPISIVHKHITAEADLWTPQGQVHRVVVPSRPARTREQRDEWGRVWPVQLLKLGSGEATARNDAPRGWPTSLVHFLQEVRSSVEKEAQAAQARGALGTSCAVFRADKEEVVVCIGDERKGKDGVAVAEQELPFEEHVAFGAIRRVAEARANDYLMVGMSAMLSHEPCVACAMALLHSRVDRVYYVRDVPGSGAFGSVYHLHEDQLLNHEFEVWKYAQGDDTVKRVQADV